MKRTAHIFILIVLLIVNPHLYSQKAIVTTIHLDGSLSLDGLLVGPDGTLYGTAGFDGSKIYKINLDGSTEVFADNLNGPIDMDYDLSGNLYVSTFNDRGLFKISPQVEITRFAIVNLGPSGVVLNRSTGSVYVSHYGVGFPGNGRTVYTVDSTGVVGVLAQDNGLNVPVSLAIDDDGNLYAPNISDAKLFKITPGGDISLLAELPTSIRHTFNIGHIEYANGALYVTGNFSQPFVYKVQLNGEYEIIAGTGLIGQQDGPALKATFNAPNGITKSLSGDTLFISELNSPGTVRMLILSTVTGIEERFEQPFQFQLRQNYPNPFNPNTTITYELPTSENIKISIYNTAGQLMATLVDEYKNAGIHSVEWNASKVVSGIYLYRFEAGAYSAVKKGVLVR